MLSDCQHLSLDDALRLEGWVSGLSRVLRTSISVHKGGDQKLGVLMVILGVTPSNQNLSHLITAQGKKSEVNVTN
ncbi:hypothetical protein BH20ACI3_BH20ACI3_35160 [soil metagenome]